VGRMNAVALKYVQDLIDNRLPDYIAKGEAFDPAYEMNRMTFRIICEAAFEYVDVTDEDYKEMMVHLEVGLREFIMRQAANPIRAALGSLIPSVRQAHKSANAFREYCRKILKAYQANPNKSPEPTLIKLVNENKTIEHDEEQKLVELTNWVIAGHDTTGYSLSNLLVLLSKNPSAQEKLRKATQGQKKDPHLTAYFQNVIKEGSRLIPVAALGSVREAHRDFTTKDGFTIPKGAWCFMTQYHGNRNPSIFEKPDDFCPERWEDPTKAMLDQLAPFSVGPRSCPGRSLAMAEINSTLPRLLEGYSFEVVEEGELDFFLTLKVLGARLKATKL
jgi:cytochrome P450